jgi:hypothetical protein
MNQVTAVKVEVEQRFSKKTQKPYTIYKVTGDNGEIGETFSPVTQGDIGYFQYNEKFKKTEFFNNIPNSAVSTPPQLSTPPVQQPQPQPSVAQNQSGNYFSEAAQIVRDYVKANPDELIEGEKIIGIEAYVQKVVKVAAYLKRTTQAVPKVAAKPVAEEPLLTAADLGIEDDIDMSEIPF